MVTAVLWLQSVLCFAVWVGYGVWLARSSVAKSLLPQSRRGLIVGPILLILSMGVLAGALYIVSNRDGIGNGVLRPWAVVLVLATGLAFVHAQSLGALMLFGASLRPETRRHRQASVQKEDSP